MRLEGTLRQRKLLYLSAAQVTVLDTPSLPCGYLSHHTVPNTVMYMCLSLYMACTPHFVYPHILFIMYVSVCSMLYISTCTLDHVPLTVYNHMCISHHYCSHVLHAVCIHKSFTSNTYCTLLTVHLLMYCSPHTQRCYVTTKNTVTNRNKTK